MFQAPLAPLEYQDGGITSTGKSPSNMDGQFCRSWDMCSDSDFQVALCLCRSTCAQLFTGMKSMKNGSGPEVHLLAQVAF